ncbi:MAG: hypothetical protein ABII89_02745 [Candidatus Omnitrophota bacterium]
MLKIPRSTYYYRPENRVKMKTDNDLRDRIEEVALEFSKYGYRHITHQLKDRRILRKPQAGPPHHAGKFPLGIR